MIKEDLVALLEADSSLAALIDDRVFPLVIPEENFDSVSRKPCLVYERNSVERGQTYCGTDGLTRSSFRFTAFARDPDEAEAVATALRNILLDYRGVLSSETFVRNISLETESDGLDIEPGLYRVDQIYTIWHSQP